MGNARTDAAEDFLGKAVIGNMFDIQASEIARLKSHNDNVRQLAERIISDHTAIGGRLKAAAQRRQVPSNLDQQHEQTLSALRSAPEGSFDIVYIDSQIENHREAVEAFDRYSQSGDDTSLKQFARQTLPALRDHLKTIEEIRKNLRAAAQEGSRESSLEGGQEQARIVVEQPAPSVHVEQPSPQVTVEQAQPSVTVRQPQPEIYVWQPQPTVTVEIPQPEITIKMPPPSVDVSMAQPQVEVSQPKPHVEVTQPEQPKVEVERAQPQVQLERQGSVQPRIDVQQAEGMPTVRYEGAEPRLVVKQAQGEPKVRYEHAEGGSAAAAVVGETSTRQASMPETGAARMAGRPEAASAETRGQSVPASQLESLNLYDTEGSKIGGVNRVVMDEGGRCYVVVGVGGFLGIGERDLAIPADKVIFADDRLVIGDISVEEINSMPAFKTSQQAYKDLGEGQEVRLGASR